MEVVACKGEKNLTTEKQRNGEMWNECHLNVKSAKKHKETLRDSAFNLAKLCETLFPTELSQNLFSRGIFLDYQYLNG